MPKRWIYSTAREGGIVQYQMVIDGMWCTYPGRQGGGRLFQEIPQVFLIAGAGAVAKLFLVPLLKTLGFLAHLFVNVLLTLVIFVLATGLEVELVNAPIFQVVGEGNDAHFLHQMQLARPVEIEDG